MSVELKVETLFATIQHSGNEWTFPQGLQLQLFSHLLSIEKKNMVNLWYADFKLQNFLFSFDWQFYD